MFDFKQYLWNILITLDQNLNTLTGGDPDETLSSRWAKKARQGDWLSCQLCRVLSWFDKDHCERTIELDEGKNSAVD